MGLVTPGTFFLVIWSHKLGLDFTFQRRLSIIGYRIGMWRKVGVFAAMSGQLPRRRLDDGAKPRAVRVCVLIPVRSSPSSCGTWLGAMPRTPKPSRPYAVGRWR